MTNAWMPRVGVAYSPGNSGKTSIRAGFGRSFDVLVDNFGLLTLPPQATTTVDVTGFDQGGIPGRRRHYAERLGRGPVAGRRPRGHGRIRSQPGAPRISPMEHRHCSTCSTRTTLSNPATWVRAESTCRYRRS